MDLSVERAVKMLSGTVSEQVQAAASLSWKAMTANNVSSMLTAVKPLVKALIYSLKRSSPDDEMLMRCLTFETAKTLAYLAEDEMARAIIIREGAVKPIVGLLSSKEMHVQCFAVMAVRILACDPTANVPTAAVVPRMVEMLSSISTEIQSEAAMALANVATVNKEAIGSIVAAGAVPILVKLLSANVEAVVRTEAAGALGRLAYDTSTHRVIVNAGAIGPLCSLLVSRTSDMAEKTSAVMALSHLAYEDEECQEMISSSGAIAPLVQLLRAESEEMQELAAQAICNVTSLTPRNAALAIGCGSIPLLTRLLSTRNCDVQAGVLTSCLS